MTEGTTITVLVALAGAAVGAWLNSSLASRRERWNLRRELYTRLLENLGEARDALSSLCDAEQVGPQQSSNEKLDDELRQQWEARNTELFKRYARSSREIRLASSVAAVMLGDDALQARDQLHEERVKA